MSTIKIPQGNHYSFNFPTILYKPTSLEFDAIMDNSAAYLIPYPDMLDINKLYGFSRGYHMWNSGRVGWRWNPSISMIEYFGFVQFDGVFDYRLIGTSKPNETVKFKIEYFTVSPNTEDEELTYIFHFNGEQQYEYTHSASTSGMSLDFPVGYRLFPYFGGNQVAPHTINININNIIQS